MRYNLPLIFHLGGDGMIHWYPDDPGVARCGESISKETHQIIEYKDVMLDKLCLTCASYLFNAIIMGSR
jgi:hypothetical protein